MLNIASLISGACAWLFSGLAIAAPKSSASSRNSFISVSLCAVSLLFQLGEIYRRAHLNDYAGIEDTIRAIVIASCVLVSITIILNLIAVVKTKNK